MEEQTFPGINRNVKLSHFSIEEQEIIRRLSQQWYVTNGGGEIKLGPTSTYRFFLIKPTPIFQEAFNLEREIIVVLSPYDRFEPRTLDAFDVVKKIHQELRLERICTVLVSRDPDIEERITTLLKNDQELQVIVPFTYSELLTKDDIYFASNRFRKYFYSRDLFDFQSPLKKELYFFGMRTLVQTLLNKHQSNENTSLFGLRKSGKTSLIFGVERSLERSNVLSTRIDCESPAMHKRRWNEALWYVLYEIREKYNLKTAISPQSLFTEQNCALIFEKEIKELKRELNNERFVLIFDEIEQISFSTSPSSHWRDDTDFVFFWQTLRSLFQKNTSLFSYMIVGTSPMCIETAMFKGVDNPLFQQTSPNYIPHFDVDKTKEMVQTLGGSMGLHFDALLFGKLCEDFGGHPFIIRQVCSHIHRSAPVARPVRVDRTMYQEAKKHFQEDPSNYIHMILVVLQIYYPDEYDMLIFLATGDTETFLSLAEVSGNYTNHLLGYGIIERTRGGFDFRIEAVRSYLAETQRYRTLASSNDERWAEISERRNKLEPQLRQTVRRVLQTVLGKSVAKDAVLQVLGPAKKAKYGGLAYEALFNGKDAEVYFNELTKIVVKYWSNFEHVFGTDRSMFERRMNTINKSRNDAHANSVSDEDLSNLRSCLTALSEQVADYD